MNKSTGNMYDFVDYTWNPVKGRCWYNCAYCYVKRWGTPGEQHLDEKELNADLGEGNVIFICSGIDLFGPFIQDRFIHEVISRRKQYPGNQYLWHTKNPRYAAKKLSPLNDVTNDTLCATIESDFVSRRFSGAPNPAARVEGLRRYPGRRMITIEPILDFDLEAFTGMLLAAEPVQINIGANSGHYRLPEPPSEKIIELIETLKPHTVVHLKKNLARIIGQEAFARYKS